MCSCREWMALIVNDVDNSTNGEKLCSDCESASNVKDVVPEFLNIKERHFGKIKIFGTFTSCFTFRNIAKWICDWYKLFPWYISLEIINLKTLVLTKTKDMYWKKESYYKPHLVK